MTVTFGNEAIDLAYPSSSAFKVVRVGEGAHLDYLLKVEEWWLSSGKWMRFKKEEEQYYSDTEGADETVDEILDHIKKKRQESPYDDSFSFQKWIPKKNNVPRVQAEVLSEATQNTMIEDHISSLFEKNISNFESYFLNKENSKLVQSQLEKCGRVEWQETTAEKTVRSTFSHVDQIIRNKIKSLWSQVRSKDQLDPKRFDDRSLAEILAYVDSGKRISFRESGHMSPMTVFYFEGLSRRQQKNLLEEVARVGTQIHDLKEKRETLYETEACYFDKDMNACAVIGVQSRSFDETL
ncbi:MAG: hypothetical protein CL678_09215 [Bdellovibrionaceae bacterium]|nr:hypothetical protein [Pseudobdellovibrionaceae bacterium]|tara:strand:+ start:1657 stop:2541 length:885 start_codon:yes stop_codon:yes gene_type:complete